PAPASLVPQCAPTPSAANLQPVAKPAIISPAPKLVVIPTRTTSTPAVADARMAPPTPVTSMPAAKQSTAPLVATKPPSRGSLWKIAVAGLVVVGSLIGLNALGGFGQRQETSMAVETPASAL